ncbi:hypothetical protein B0T16DRAFT_334704 [Cercophora newfieldiana]|uniref:Heterokaryon incompatibility domain-containing protein n=1 Tax=Cercophora newfieldiana TaxID=92897 RepID=A0AA39XYS4_9PEZI|nr:hypothetical protein B0T16DRAFT_334704 [Cercophora newfieldiana]
MSLRASLANIDRLSKPGALNQRADGTRDFEGKRVSRTVADAMRFVKDLGHRYLWVDALCIIQ